MGCVADHIFPEDMTYFSLSPLQIDWPAPQDKKRECVAKGKNNQVTWILADRVSGVTHWQEFLRHHYSLYFTQLHLFSQFGVANWKPSSHCISTQ